MFVLPSSYQRTFSRARTVGSGTAVSGTCRPTSCTTAPAGRSSRQPPRPRHKTNPRSPTPMNASAPFRSATRAAPVPAHWRSTCAHTVVRARLIVNSVYPTIRSAYLSNNTGHKLNSLMLFILCHFCRDIGFSSAL